MSEPTLESPAVVECDLCRRLTRRTRVCDRCEARMDSQLVDVLEFYALTSTELMPGRSGEASGSERGLGVRLAALDFLAGNDVVSVLASWVDAWRDHYGLSNEAAQGRPPAVLSASVTFLRAWLPTACKSYPVIDEFSTELRECWLQARSAARLSSGSGTVVPCPTVHEDGSECGARLPIDTWLALDHDQSTSQPATCPRCGVTRDIQTLITVAMSDGRGEVWVDAEAASRQFGLGIKALADWHKRGVIRRDKHGRYGLADISAAVHGTKEA